MKKILIVDDKPAVRELIEATLQSTDRQIFYAASGDQAVETARRIRPDLILMDVMMPGKFDGFEATRILKNDPETKNVIIILLTAVGQQHEISEGLSAGADDYFIKPFSPLELLKTVEKFVG